MCLFSIEAQKSSRQTTGFFSKNIFSEMNSQRKQIKTMTRHATEKSLLNAIYFLLKYLKQKLLTNGKKLVKPCRCILSAEKMFWILKQLKT